MRTEASYSHTGTKGISKASSCAVGVAHECSTKNLNAEFCSGNGECLSLGAKPAQAEGECSIVHRLDTVALLHTCFPCFQT